jgi:hypothetical protein
MVSLQVLRTTQVFFLLPYLPIMLIMIFFLLPYLPTQVFFLLSNLPKMMIMKTTQDFFLVVSAMMTNHSSSIKIYQRLAIGLVGKKVVV